MADEDNPNNKQGKPWKPGESGNPKGRPKGSKNTATLLQQQLTEELLNNQNLNKRAKKILNQALQMAEDGDKQMLKFFLNKWLPDSGIAFGKDEESSQPAITINIGGTEDAPKTIEHENIEDVDDST